ncbi:collagenase [Microbulbifer sp. SA54]|uniref:collagenase n=1 Tax=Microbulbifer sp. SA54 TaxID=3401577 RepID=UPI003AADAFEC
MRSLRFLSSPFLSFFIAVLAAAVTGCSGGGAPGQRSDTTHSTVVHGDATGDLNQEQILPIQHTCSETLFLLAQAMSDAELNDSCATLAAAETRFHYRLRTEKRPVAEDFNDELRVVVFNNYEQYYRYAYDFFGINTDNGGLYIEGNPADPDNLASFYAHEADWLLPEFVIWNLQHEHIHYLEGRFVSYGGFAHFPDHHVWWAEGLAEYLSLGNDNPEVLEMLRDTSSESQSPALSEIFATDYSGTVDEIYSWSYLAVRFLFENHYEEVLAMTNSLKIDDFDRHKTHLDSWEVNYQEAFQGWLVALAQGGAEGAPRPASREAMLHYHAIARHQEYMNGQ